VSQIVVVVVASGEGAMKSTLYGREILWSKDGARTEEAGNCVMPGTKK
jgi:hypothetical protein